jgi:hypothetical protein
VLLAGFAVAYPMRFGTRPASIIAALTPAVFGVTLHFAWHRWMISSGWAPGLRSSGAAYMVPASFAAFAVASLKLTLNVVPYIGLFILPLVISWKQRSAGRGTVLRVLCGVLAAAAFGALWHGGGISALGNVLLPSGVGPLTLDGGAPPTSGVGAAVWLGAIAFGAYGAWLALCRLALFARSLWLQRRMPSRAGAWLLPFYATILLAYWLLSCIVAFNNGFFDRYLLFIIPVALVVMCATARPGDASRIWVPSALLLLLAGLSVAGTHDYLAWNRARWAAADFLIQQH